jgi:hypothetical protein
MIPRKRSTQRYGNLESAGELAADDATNWRAGDQVSAPEEHIGMVVSMIVLTVALVMLVIWAQTRPSFERCSELPTVSARSACYEELRRQEMQPPAKGASAPAGTPKSEN